MRDRNIPENWLTGGADPRRLPEQVVENSTRWDWRDWEKTHKEMAAFAAATDELAEFAESGRPLMADVWMSLFKVQPRLRDGEGVRPDRIVNRFVMGEMFDLSEYQDLHRYTSGDDVAAAMACVTLEPTCEELLDKQDKRQKEADELQELLAQLQDALTEQESIDDLIEKWRQERAEDADNAEGGDDESVADGEADEPEDQPEGEGEGDGEGEGEGEGDGPGGSGCGDLPSNLAGAAAAAAGKVTDLQAQIKALARQLLDGLANTTAETRRQLAKALAKAAAEARSLTESADAWGVEKGALMRMPADERLALAKRLNTDRFRRIAELFGPMKQLMLTEQARKVHYVKTDLVDIETGQDLEAVLLEELANLDDPDLEWQFWLDYDEGKLLQYRLEGEERVAKGGIIFCEDGSASMHGEPELWAKAVMLCLLHLARQQGRAFYLIHFGSKGEVYPMDFSQPEDFTTDRILAAAELFCNGGTDFESPINAAVERLQAEFKAKGRVEGDIVFATDGICGVTERWMEWYREEQSRLKFETWGIAINHYGGDKMAKTMEPLCSLADGKVATVADLLQGGDIREVFRGV